MTSSHIEIKLECNHSLWFTTPIPRPGDTLWCKACEQWETVYPAHASFGDVYEDDMKTTPLVGGGYRATCTHDSCAETATGRDWHKLKLQMHRHYMQTHTRFGSTLTIVTVDRLPPNSPAPF